jgi:hypothetical protein
MSHSAYDVIAVYSPQTEYVVARRTCANCFIYGTLFADTVSWQASLSLATATLHKLHNASTRYSARAGDCMEAIVEGDVWPQKWR